MIVYYRKSIPGYLEVAHSLIKLTHEKQSFEWGQGQSKSFQIQKSFEWGTDSEVTRFWQKIYFSHGRFQRRDWCSIWAAGRIGKRTSSGVCEPGLNKAGRNYSTTEREALAIFWAVKYFHTYLHNIHFRIVTDHHALRWLKSAGDGVLKLMSCSMKIDSYDIFTRTRRNTQTWMQCLD